MEFFRAIDNNGHYALVWFDMFVRQIAVIGEEFHLCPEDHIGNRKLPVSEQQHGLISLH
jgi:hypothetical protein